MVGVDSPRIARPQHADVGGQDGAGGLQPDGAVVDGLGAGGEGLQVREITRVGEAEGRGKQIRHTKNTTGWAPVERRRGAV